MKTDLTIAIILFVFLIGIGAGMLWRSVQVEPVLQARIEFLEEERQILRERLFDKEAQLGIAQGKGKRR